MNEVIAKAIVIENTSVVCLARVRASSGSYLTQATTTSLTVKVFNLNDRSQSGATQTPSKTSCVFDTLQTDARWSEDSTGYNLAVPITADYLTDGNIVYQVECKLVTTDSMPFYILWQVQTKDILSE
jgi:hypothetical protein